MQTPRIDPRTRDDLSAQTTGLAARYSTWRAGRPDPGTAVIGVFARFAELVVDTINQAPDRHYLTYLNLIGAERLAPLPARVPLTFTLAEGATTGTAVPASTEVAAPGAGTSAEAAPEVIFATDTDLVVSPARLICLVVGDPENDTWSDRTGAGEPFAVFEGDDAVPHELLLAVGPGDDRAPVGDLTLRLAGTRTHWWSDGSVVWSCWDGSGWLALAPRIDVTAPGTVLVRFTGLPALPPLALGGVTAGWLCANVTHALPPGDDGVPPESVAVGGRNPQDPWPGLAPFADDGQGRLFYLSADDALAPGGATAHLRLGFSTPGAAPRDAPVTVAWTYRTGNLWRPLDVVDTTAGFTRDGDIAFVTPTDWPQDVFRGRIGRWLRAEATAGSFTTPPVLESMVVDYEWLLPEVNSATFAAGAVPPAAPVTAGLFNGAPVDTSKDFRPFGEQPVFNDTFHLAAPTSGGPLTLSVTLRNPRVATPPVTGPGAPVPVTATPQLTWETFDGSGWRPATASRADVFTVPGDVVITPAAVPQPSMVAGETQTWIRVRLTGSDYYGSPAGYTFVSGQGYVPGTSTLAPPVVAALAWRLPARASAPVPACLTRNGFQYVAGRPGPGFTPFVPDTDHQPALYLGFDLPFEPRPVTLFLPVTPPAPEEVAADRLAQLDPTTAAQVVWEYLSPGGWKPLAALDGTQAFSARGQVTFIGPGDQSGAEDRFGVRARWLRARWHDGYFSVAPRIGGVLPNTTWATQAVVVDGEILGSGSGEPAQSFTTALNPVLPGAVVEIDEGEDAAELWVAWQPVADFYGSGPIDPHYVLEQITGTLTFGDGAAGRPLPRGQGNVRVSYRSGGGVAGNVPAGTVAALKTSIPTIDAVVNHLAAAGGAAEESVEQLTERAPRMLRHRDRAITVQDIEDLSRDASTEVARVKGLPPIDYAPLDVWLDPLAPPGTGLPPGYTAPEDAGVFGVVVVPDSDVARPTPAVALLERVRSHLAARCPATASLWVSGPEWIQVTVRATVAPSLMERTDQVRSAVQQALSVYLHPLTGGPAAQGWAFGRKPHRSDLFALVEAVDGVDHVHSLDVTHDPQSEDLGPRLTTALGRSLADAAANPLADDLRRWLDRSLVFSGDHVITMRAAG